MSIQLRDGLSNQPVDHVLEDLLVRFVINCPEEDLSSIERVFFQVEEAQWFYSDFVGELNPSLPKMAMRSFAPRLLSKCPLVWKWGDPADSLAQFGKYKLTIPVRGIALLNRDMTKVVLVQDIVRKTWSFPRGKISKDEADLTCAIREVKEETGFDAKDCVDEKDVMERTVYGKNFKIYFARNVPEDYAFEPLARNEISQIKWFDVDTLPAKVKLKSKFFLVEQFLKPLSRWINRYKGVVSDEELMRDAEIRLKELMGIRPVSDSADAGRELLDILQGAAKPAAAPNSAGSPAVAPYIHMTVPQHLQNFYAGMGQMPGFLPPNWNGYMPMQPYGYFPPPRATPVPPNVGVPGQALFPGQMPPTLRSQGTPTLPTQSVPTLLSQGAPTVPTEAPAAANPAVTRTIHSPQVNNALSPQNTENTAETAENMQKKEEEPRTRAAEFLQMLNMKVPKPKEPPVILQRDGSDASATLLGLLGKKPPVAEPVAAPTPQSGANASKELLGLINRKKESPEAEKQENAAKSGNSVAADILGIINQKPRRRDPVVEELEPRPIEHSSDFLRVLNGGKNERKEGERSEKLENEKSQNAPAEDVKASGELLGILNRKPVRIATRGNTPDLKSVLGENSPSTESSPLLILGSLNRKSTPKPKLPKATPTPPVEDFQDFEDFEDFDNFEGVSESQKEIYNSIAHVYDDAFDDDSYDEASEPATALDPPASVPEIAPKSEPAPPENFTIATNTAGKSLLLILNGGAPPSSALQHTYGAAEPSAPMPMPTSPTNNSGDFLRVLGRRPPETPSDGRNELLRILKGA